jgi:hypothetical protein
MKWLKIILKETKISYNKKEVLNPLEIKSKTQLILRR